MTIYRSHLDRISIFVSGLCMVHCIVLPLFLTTLPLWGIEVLENVYLEIATIVVALIAGGWAIWKGYRTLHRRLVIPLLFSAGLSLMSAANFSSTELVEMTAKGIGSGLVIAAHIMNWRSSRRCAVCAN